MEGFLYHVVMIDRNGVSRSVFKNRDYNFVFSRLRRYRYMYPKRTYYIEIRT